MDFVEDHAISFAMVWDESFETWRHYGISGQPAWILIDPSGEPVDSWSGRLDEDEVVELARQHQRA